MREDRHPHGWVQSDGCYLDKVLNMFQNVRVHVFGRCGLRRPEPSPQLIQEGVLSYSEWKLAEGASRPGLPAHSLGAKSNSPGACAPAIPA